MYFNSNGRKVSQIIENTFVDRLEDITKIKIKAIDEYQKRDKTPRA